MFSFDDAALPVGDNPQSFSVGNCDLDGTPDVIAAGFDADSISLFLNDGSGTLLHHVTLDGPSKPAGAACGDFTGDGLVDLAVTSWADSTVTLYRAGETGGFSQLTTLPVGNQPRAVTSADVNLDGKMDLVVVNSGSSDLTLLLGNGAGGFTSVANIRLPSTNQNNRPRAAAVADFNKDGLPDIAVASQGTPSLRLLLGTGLGFQFFQPQAQLPAAGKLVGIAAADYDNDMIPDLALLSAESARDSAVSLYRGNGDGTFTKDIRIPVRASSKAVALADFDGDGLVDLALSYSDANGVQVIRALAEGRFPACGIAGQPFECPISPSVNPLGNVQLRVEDDINQLIFVDPTSRAINLLELEDLEAPTVTPLLALEDTPEAMLLADMTNDGILDAVVVHKARRALDLAIHFGNATGGFAPAAGPVEGQLCGDGILEGSELCDDGNLAKKDGCSPTCRPEIDRGLLFLEAVDLDNDANQDLVTVDARGRLRIFFGDGHGRLRAIGNLGAVKRKSTVGVGDFTGDGFPDIAYLPKKRREGALRLLVNDGAGVFTPTPITLAGSRPRLAAPMLTADVDRNGFADLILQNQGKPKGIAVLYSDGAGPLRSTVVTEVPRGPTTLAAADFNEDGWLDALVQFKSRRQAPLLLLGSPANGLAPGPAVAVPDGRTHLTILDVDEDLHYDLVACGTSGPSCRILFGDGRAQFRNTPLPGTAAVGRDVRGAVADDFDADGHVDLAGVSRRDSLGKVHFGGPDPLAITLETGTKPGAMKVADFDNDGRNDLVVANEGSRDLSIFTNAGNRQFNTLARVKLPAGGAGPVALAVAHVDSDATLDIAVTQGTIPRVTVLLNTAGFAAFVNLETGAGPRGVALAKLNGDSLLDIVTANHDANTLSVFLSTPANTYVRTDIPSGGLEPWDVAAGDMNGDGFDDLTVVNGLRAAGATEGNVVTFMNAGDGSGALTPTLPAIVHGRETPTGVCVGDFDGDLALDVAIASVGTADISMLNGDGLGGWSGKRRCVPAGAPLSAISCGDADGDGRTDIVFGRRQGSDVGIILTGEVE